MRKVIAGVLILIVSATLLYGLKNKQSKNVKKEAAKMITLPKPDLENKATLMKALKMRQSNRSFSSKELSHQEISNLLWATNGTNRDNGKTTAPTLWNLDIYVALKEGLYLYNYKKHSLELKLDEDIREITGEQGFTSDAPLNLIFVVDYKDMTDSWVKSLGGKDLFAGNLVGYVSQNVYLYSAANNLSTVALAWFDQKKLKTKLKLSKTEKVILTQPVGYPGK